MSARPAKKITASLFPITAVLFVLTACSDQDQASTAPDDPASQPPAAELTIFTEDYPPLNYQEDGELTGQATAIVQELAAEVGASPSYKLTSWDEGIRAVTNDPGTALYSVAMSEERKGRMQWVGPIGSLDTSLYARAGSAITLSNLDDARQADGIATVAGYYSEELLQEEGFTNLIRHDSEQAAMESLLNGEATLLVTSNTALPGLLEQAQADGDAVRPVFSLSTDLTYLAFSPDVDSERVARWQEALDGMKQDGRFQAISREWLPNSQPPGAIQLVTEDYPPLTYQENGETTGFVTDVVREITDRLDISEPIRLTTWANAYDMARIHPNMVLFSTERTPQREELFHWVGPLGSNNAILYAKAGTELTLENEADAREVETIATTSGWFTEQYLRDEGFDNLKSSPEPTDAVRMVMAGEAELTILTDSTAPQIVADAGYTMADLEPLLTVMTTDYYITLSQGTPEGTVRQWRQALKALEADGTVEELRQRYSPYDEG